MAKRAKWLWVVLFIFLAALMAGLATSWNVVLLRDYRAMLDLAAKIELPNQIRLQKPNHALGATMLLGTLGFVSALGLIILFFVRLLREMKANQQQNEFLAAVTHELKTPLATLELTASLLSPKGSPETPSAERPLNDTLALWDAHQAELARLREQVHALLEAARIQAHATRLQPRPVHLEPWLERGLTRWRLKLGSTGKIERSGPALDFESDLDDAAMDLILDNLLENARKFSHGKPQILITTEASRNGWKISVQDHGTGFDPRERKRIFRRFYRGQTGREDRPIPGTGLGLYLAATAAKTLKLKLGGASEGKGRGATFWLESHQPPRGLV